MEYRVLRYFLAVAEEGSILHASEVLNITQPSLSRQLAQLEDELGTRLFIRGRRRITLTEAGVMLKRRAEEILSLTAKTEQEIASFSQKDKELAGTIHIGAGEIAAVSRLAGIMKAFSNRYPKVGYSFYSGNADAIKEQLDNGLLDAGLLLKPVDYGKYDYIETGVEEKWVVLMRADDPLVMKDRIMADDLKGRKLLMPDRDIVHTRFSSWFPADFDNSDVLITKNLMNNAALMVEQGLGYAIGVECVPAMYNSERFCYRPLYPEITTESVLVWKKSLPEGSLAGRFLEFASLFIKQDNK